MIRTGVNFREVRHTLSCEGGCTSKLFIEMQTDESADVPPFLEDEVHAMLERLAAMLMWIGHRCPRCAFEAEDTGVVEVVA